MCRPALILAIALSVAACDSNPVGPSDLVGASWNLQSIQQSGSGPVEVADPSRYTVMFDDDGRVGAKSDCNSCGGPYTLSGSTLDIGPLACTKVHCGDDSLDMPFSTGLDTAHSVSVEGDLMTIEGEGVTLRLRR